MLAARAPQAKKIYDEVPEDIFDMSNVRFFKENEKKKMGDVYTLFCLRIK